MDKITNRKAHSMCPPQLLMSTVYSLNESFSRKVYMGFQIDLDGSPVAEIRICSSDFVGIRLTRRTWISFIRYLSRFSERESANVQPGSLSEVGLCLRFVGRQSCYVEIIDIANDRSVFLDYDCFHSLKKISPVVSARLDYLETVLCSFEFIMCRIVGQAERRFRETRENFRKDSLLASDPKFTDIEFEELAEMLKGENLYRLTVQDIRIIYNEIVNLRYIANNFCQHLPSFDSEEEDLFLDDCEE